MAVKLTTNHVVACQTHFPECRDKECLHLYPHYEYSVCSTSCHHKPKGKGTCSKVVDGLICEAFLEEKCKNMYCDHAHMHDDSDDDECEIKAIACTTSKLMTKCVRVVNGLIVKWESEHGSDREQVSDDEKPTTKEEENMDMKIETVHKYDGKDVASMGLEERVSHIAYLSKRIAEYKELAADTCEESKMMADEIARLTQLKKELVALFDTVPMK